MTSGMKYVLVVVKFYQVLYTQAFSTIIHQNGLYLMVNFNYTINPMTIKAWRILAI